MCRFSYLVYRGKFPLTVQLNNSASYCCIVEVSKKELNGSNRNRCELEHAARHLIRYSLRDRYLGGENLVEILLRCEPEEISPEQFKRAKKIRLDPLRSVPGGVYRVKPWLSSYPSAAIARTVSIA
jgi:hypothetical protein